MADEYIPRISAHDLRCTLEGALRRRNSECSVPTDKGNLRLTVTGQDATGNNIEFTGATVDGKPVRVALPLARQVKPGEKIPLLVG